MIVKVLACASSCPTETDWRSINWVKCHQTVRRLQMRIVKATQAGKHNKVKTLQWMLTHSFSGKALAVKRVTENRGKNTPGVDKVTWSTPEAKSKAILSLKRRGYKPLPLRRLYIPKANGKKRPLGIPAIKDRAMQALHLLALEPIAEAISDENSYGFRPERSTADAIEQCFCALARKASAKWILEGDITGCFDNINHQWLLENTPTDKTILQKWLKAGYVENQTLFPSDAGTPQGGIISPVLANIALNGLEKMLKTHFPKIDLVHVVRYADDFIVTARSQETLEHKVKPLVERFMAERGLSLSPEKTQITHIERGFDFLGQNIRKYKDKLIIKPSRKNIKAFLDKVRGIVKENKSATQANIIIKLNPLIRGWANYHRHVVSSKTFHAIDHEIWWILWQWAKRRHPKKGKRWIKSRYFKKLKKRNGAFMVKTNQKLSNGKLKILALLNASDISIRRHVKIRAKSNPYDPKWKDYFDVRHRLRMINHLKVSKKLLPLWLKQEGRCSICNEKLTETSGWHVHHIIPRKKGGSDESSNLMMLHPNCHRQVHGKRLKVVEPAPAKGL